MKEEIKFKLKAFLYYIFIQPLISKYYIFNLSYISWFLIFLSLLFKQKLISTILILVAIMLYLIKEYKDGNYIYWYRNKKYPQYKEALMRVREQKRLNSPVGFINGGKLGDGTENQEIN